MLIGELLQKLEKQSMSEVCREIGVNPTTVQRKLKSLGYKWNNSARKWFWDGKEAQPLDLDITELINKPVNKNVNTPARDPKPEKKVAADPAGHDIFDQLLNPNPNPKRKVQRGFYFDDDVIKALDKNVKSNNKSAFVNESLKQTLKAKGLL